MSEIISSGQQVIHALNNSTTLKIDNEGNLKKAGFLDKVKNFFTKVFNGTEYAARKAAIDDKIIDILSQDKKSTDITDKSNTTDLKELSSKLSSKFSKTATLLNIYSTISNFPPETQKLAKACIENCQLQEREEMPLDEKLTGLEEFINKLAQFKPMDQIDKNQLQDLNNKVKENIQNYIKTSTSDSFNINNSQLQKDIGRQTIIVNNNKFMDTDSADKTKINNKLNAVKQAIPNKTHLQFISTLLNQTVQSDIGQLFLNKSIAEMEHGLKAPDGFFALDTDGSSLLQLGQASDLSVVQSDAQKGHAMYDLQVHYSNGKIVGATIKCMSQYCVTNTQLGGHVLDPIVYGNTVFEVDLTKADPKITDVNVSYSIGKPEYYTGKKTENTNQEINKVNNQDKKPKLKKINMADKFGNDFTNKFNSVLANHNTKLKNKN